MQHAAAQKAFPVPSALLMVHNFPELACNYKIKIKIKTSRVGVRRTHASPGISRPFTIKETYNTAIYCLRVVPTWKATMKPLYKD